MKTEKRILSILLSVLLCFGLLCLPAAAEGPLPESAHPYENNSEQTWEYTYPGDVNGFFMTFSEDTSFEESSFLFLDENGEAVSLSMSRLAEMGRVIFDEEGSEEAARLAAYMETLTFQNVKRGDMLAVTADGQYICDGSGTTLAGKTIYVPGRTVTLRLFSDESETDYGFRVERVSETAPEGVLTVSYYLDADAPMITCYEQGDAVYIDSNDNLLTDDGACIGWSTTPGGPAVFTKNEEITLTESLSLYPVTTPILLRPDEVFSFGNDYSSFAVHGVTVNVDDIALLELTNYYMERADILALLKNFSKTLGITPTGLAAIREAMLLPASLWGGSCYGIAVAAALQHYGMLDLLSMQEDAETVRDLYPSPELVSMINYYQAQELPAVMTQTTADYPGTPWYRMQLQKIYETVKNGEMVLFCFYELHSYDSLGHAVLLTGAYDDPDGNHVLIAYDSNFGADYAEGYVDTKFVIAPDYSGFVSGDGYFDWYAPHGVSWLSDFSGFDAFRRDGSGDAMNWYQSVFAHFRALFAMLKELFALLSLR